MLPGIRLLWIWAMIPYAISLEFKYHNAKDLESFLHRINTNYPSITHLYSIGKSVEGVDLWVLAIGKHPQEHVVGIPEVKYIGNVHGDELVGREMLLHLVEHLVEEYGKDSTITQIISSTRIHIMPSMNPDGYAMAELEEYCMPTKGRYNKAGIDLNRNFPDVPVWDTSPPSSSSQPETEAVMNWILNETFVLSLSLHGGAVVASYPYDSRKEDSKSRGYSKCPDDDVFMYLAKNFSYNHATMYFGNECETTPYFKDGITNGADWYPFRGGMQDFNYIQGQCFELTVELSCCKNPPSYTLENFWNESQISLINFFKLVHLGVKGQVLDHDGKPIKYATVKVQDRENIIPFQTNQHGEYYRLLLPGTYKLEVSATGFQTKTFPLEILDNVSNFSALVSDLRLSNNVLGSEAGQHSGIASIVQENTILLTSVFFSVLFSFNSLDRYVSML
ncbi:carboxypeptidase M-like isoform X2 [Pristis pectinata]|uniref:carboxypeptidase M-like isoform X2 n=1 Tax=Pristis pectinata TaxID=685728 RepID=UPI00223D8D4E|nr:carboxypeptidase M-like isoform X2 [Pristis pectinata]